MGLVIPFKIVFDQFFEKMSIEFVMRSMCTLSILGCCALFQGARLGGSVGVNILLGDAMIFPSMYLCDGMLAGMILQRALPSGSAFDSNACNFGNYFASF